MLLLVALAPLRLALTSVLEVVEAPPCAAGPSANAFAVSDSTAHKSIVDVLMIETPVGTHAASAAQSEMSVDAIPLSTSRWPHPPRTAGVFADSDSNTFRERRFFRLPRNGPASGAAPDPLGR